MRPNDITTLWILGLLFIVLFVVIPLGVYLSGRKLKQPIVSFTARFWRFDLFLLLFLLGMQLAVMGLFGVSGITPQMFRNPKEVAVGLGFGLLFLLACGLVFIHLRVYWSYWQHDRNKGLTLYKEETLLRYWVNDDYTDYAISDVVKRTVYISKTVKESFTYTILTFKSGADILITCLICDPYDLVKLLPSAEGAVVRAWLPWLPGEPEPR